MPTNKAPAARHDPGRRRLLSPRAWSERAESYARSRAPALGPGLPGAFENFSTHRCSACNAACVSACKAGIVRRHPAGHVLAGTPWLDFSNTGCSFCGDCLRVCPQAPASCPPTPPGVAALDAGRCLAANGTVCISCLTACPTHALHRHARGAVSVEAQRCSGCGNCVAVCPTQALRVHFVNGVTTSALLTS